MLKIRKNRNNVIREKTIIKNLVLDYIRRRKGRPAGSNNWNERKLNKQQRMNRHGRMDNKD